jgi:membrane protease YdiL (CAAX protease family)
MKSLKIKKFFLDYLIGSGLIVVLFFVLIGNITIMDTNGVLTLDEACSSPTSPQDILDNAQLVLRNDERCELIQPCDELKRLRCEGTAKVSDIPKHFYAQDLLIIRVQRQLANQYGFAGYSDKSTFRVPIGLIIFFLVYLAVLVEAGALLFALWRQKSLRQTFLLPTGSKVDQLLKPLLLGMLLAMTVLAMNFKVDTLFDYPDVEQSLVNLTYLKSVSGIVLAILVAPLAEELIFRGVLLRFFIERKRQLLGVVFISILFAILHSLREPTLGWQLYKFSAFFIISAVFCWSYIKQKNLWSPIILHGGYNATMIGFLNVFA